MSNINNEISLLLKEVFFELPNNKNEFLPIIKSSNNIKQIILFMITYNTNKEEDINQNINLLFILKEFFKINTNLIPLFMKDSFFSHKMQFYDCLINLYLNEKINDENKLILEDLINFLNANFSITKHNLEFIYQKMSKYFTNEAKETLTESLLYRYLNILNHFYTDNSILNYDKNKKGIKNYLYFNGINSGLSFAINKYSCNLNTDFPTLEKGCSFVFWINLDRKLTEEYFKILPEKTYVNFVKINIGGQIILFQLINPENIRICTKNNITNDIKINNIFIYNEWNNIILIIEPSKGKKLSTKLFINNKLINGTLILSENLNSREKINNINLFENFLGKISSIIYFSFVIDQNLINHFASIKGFYKNKILLQLLNSFDKEYPIIGLKDKEKYYNEKLNKLIKIKLSDQNINNLICCFIPLTYEKNKNIINDVFGNFIGKLNNNDGVNNYINKNKNIKDLGGINNLLPIIELMISSLKDNNPYKLIDKYILSERTFQEYLIIIQKILLNHENNILNERETHFFSCLSLFMEKIPSKFYNLSILQSIIGLINLPLENISKENMLDSFIDINENTGFTSNNFINLILLNEQIITKFTPRAQMELWDGVYEVFKRDLNKVSKTLSTPKLCLLIRFYDEKRYEKYCCHKHASLFNNENIDENKNNIMEPEMNYKVGKLFEIIQLYIDEVNEQNQVEDIFKLLSLDLSPCLQKKIINLYISHFNNNNVSDERKEKTLNNLLKNKYIELSEYVLKISLLDIRIEIFKLFNFFMTKYKAKIQEHLKNNSKDISQIICFYGFNILPDKLILEIDSGKAQEKNKFVPIKTIRKEKTINEELLNINKKYLHLIDLFNKDEYEKEIESFWSLLNSSIKYEQNIIEKKNTKVKKYVINPFVFNFSLDFVSKVSAFYLEQLLAIIISALKDESIINRNIFYNDKIFFPWLIDTIFYFHNNENLELNKDQDLINSIQRISLNILCELFSHHREDNEIFKRLKYILDYTYYYKKIIKGNGLKELMRITRFLLLKIFECFNEYIDIKSKIIFEFIILFKNSENIFKDEEFHFKEINFFPGKEFIEIDENERNFSSNAWEIIDNININNNDSNNKNSINENEFEEDIYPIDDNQKSKEIRSTTIMPKKNNKNEIIIEEVILIPDYIYEGINIIDKNIRDKENNNNNLENIWMDYKLFLDINDYYQKNLWGIDCLCKLAKIDSNFNNFNNIVKDLYRFFGELKGNENILIRDILNFIDIKDKKKIKLNIFYINLILLSIAIDICQNNEEKERLYIQYKHFLLFFIVASINLSDKIKTENKTNTYSYYLNKMFYNIIGFGFIFLKNRDEEKYIEIKDCLISPLFTQEGKNIFGISKKTFYEKSVIGKLFLIKEISKDDSNIENNSEIKLINRASRAVTTFSKNNFLFNKRKPIKNSNQINENFGEHIIFRGDVKLIVTNIIDNTTDFYKNSKLIWPNYNILKFYKQRNENNEEKSDDYKFIGIGPDELNKKIIEEEKRICNTLNETIPFLREEIKKYWNNIVLDQLKRRREYKKTKKRLFSWNGFWSDRKLFFAHPEYLKLQIKNHFTKEMTKVILSPILDINYYLPQFSKFDKKKLFNKDDYKYSISLNVEEILKIPEEKNNRDINKEEGIINKEKNCKIIDDKKDIKEEKISTKINYEEKNEKMKENDIIKNEKQSKIIKEKNQKEIKENINKKVEGKIPNENNEVFDKNKPINKFSDKIKFLNQRINFNLKNQNVNPIKKLKSIQNEKKENNEINKNINVNNHTNIINNSNNIDANKTRNIIYENINNDNNKTNIKRKENIDKNNIKNCLTKDLNYLESLYKFTFKGIWEQYNKFYKGKMALGNIVLGNRDVFNILIQSKLMSSSQENKENENLYICCIVKPTHHIKGYMSTEKTSIKFTHCDEDEESQKLLEDDPSYDKELKCCFGSTFKSHIKDREKVCIEIKYEDMKFILFRNYFYQKTACEIYTFSNKSYFLNFKDNKELTKFIDNILNHEQYRTIEGEDFKGKKILGYEKTNEIKPKSFKVKKIMEEWQNNNISTLQYLMWLNIFAGRSFNDLTQYPVLPWLITNYDKEELSNNDFRDLSIPVGMMDVSPKAKIRKENFIEFYETLKADFKEANPEFNYSEYLKKADEYLEDLKTKKNKKKRDSINIADEVGLKDINISSIELNQIPYFYGTHYSCPTFVSHYLMRLFPFCLLSVEIQGNKFDDPERIFISLVRTFETASTLKEDVRELIPEFYTLPDMFLNKNNLNLTQDKLDAEGNSIIVHDVELPPWSNNISYIFVSEMRKNLEKNEIKINKWVDLIFGSLQRGEKAEEHNNIFMAQSYEGIVKIDSVTDYDTRNALMRLCEVGVTPKQLFKNDTKQRNDKIEIKGKYLYESKELYMLSVNIIKYEEITKKYYMNKSINKEYEEQIYPKIIKIKWVGTNELLLMNNLNYLTKLKYKKTSEGKHLIEEKIIINAKNISSKFSPSYLISGNNPIIFYNKNKYMIKGGFWDGRLEINSLIIDPKEKEKFDSYYIFIKEGPIICMEMTNDEKILLCGTKIGYLICFSVNGLNLSIKNKIYLHNDEITSININNNLNMFSTSSLDGYINMHILPSFDLVRSIKISVVNKNFFYGNYDDEFYYANNVFLSSSPLPCVTIFISSKRLFRTYTINGEFVEDREETKNSNYIKCSIIFNDLNFQEYLIYGTDDGRVKIRTFPTMDLINDIFPNDCNEIISMDISPDKKYCYLWNKDNKIFVIKDFYVEYDDEDKKKMEKTEKEK